MPDEALTLAPIAFYHGAEDSPALAPRQGSLVPQRPGRVELVPSLDPLCLRDLDGFERLWLLFHFHRNKTWKPLVLPPHQTKRRGVFATRSPYRPNPIGLSCVALVSIEGRVLNVTGGDLLDGTPILDIKPYLPYADAFPDAKTGWVGEAQSAGPLCDVRFTEEAEARLEFLQRAYGKKLFDLVRDQLSRAPTLGVAKRIKKLRGTANGWCFSWRRWRLHYRVEGRSVTVETVRHGAGSSDPGEFETGRAAGNAASLDEAAIRSAFEARFGSPRGAD